VNAVTLPTTLYPECKAVHPNATAVEANGDLGLPGVEQDAVGAGPERGDLHVVDRLPVQGLKRFRDGLSFGDDRRAPWGALVNPAERHLAIRSVDPARASALEPNLHHPR